jgi:hypothetical protein
MAKSTTRKKAGPVVGDEATIAASVRLPASMKADLDRAAKADARTFSSLVTKILMDWLEGEKKRPAK